METLPVAVITESEAREIARDLAQSSLADIPHLRYSLSALTSMGAQLAAALEQRNREYEALLARVALLPDEWLDLAPGTRLPDLSQLRAELVQVTTERDQLATQLAERDSLLEDLQNKLEAAQKRAKTASQASKKKEAVLEKSLSQAVTQLADVQTRMAVVEQSRAGMAQDLDARQQELGDARARIANLESELVQALAAKAGLDEQLAVRQTELSDLNHQIDRQQELLQAVLPADLIPLAEGEGEQLVGIAALAAIVDRVTEASKEQAAILVDLEDQVNGLAAERASLAASLEDREALLAELNELRARVARIDTVEARTALALALEDRPAVKRNAASAALVAGVEPQLVSRLQDLSKVTGIGAARRRRLYTSGIGTFWEFAHASNEELLQILELGKTQASTFDFAAARAEAFELARATGTQGWIWEGRQIDDFETMAGIGSAYEQRLYEHGICTYQQLASLSEEELALIIDAPEMRQPDFAGWIAEAQVLADQQRQATAEALQAAVQEQVPEPPASAASQ